MIRLNDSDELLELDGALRVRVLQKGAAVQVWPKGSDPTAVNAGLRYGGEDAAAILDFFGLGPDDLTEIDGVGDKTAAALVEAGVDTFADLAETHTDAVVSVLQDAGIIGVSVAEINGWKEAAAKLAAGEEDAEGEPVAEPSA